MLLRANTLGSGSMKIDKESAQTRNSVMANQLWYTCSTGMVDGKAVRAKRRQDDRPYDKPFDVYWTGTPGRRRGLSVPTNVVSAQENVFSLAFIALSVYIVYEILKKRTVRPCGAGCLVPPA